MQLKRAVHDRNALSSLEGGPLIEAFETAVAAAAGAQFAVGVNSGGSALVAALMSADLGDGDEVIVSPYTWGQTVSAILLVGATPVFADIDADSGNLDPASVESLVCERTRAVLVTHMYGCPADMVALRAICKRYGLVLIADAAQAMGATLGGKGIGAWADLTCLSFGRSKAIPAGEGGAVCCNDPALFERLLLISQHPLRASREVEDPALRLSIGELNLSLRIHPIAARLVLEQVPDLGVRMERRRAAFEMLTGRLDESGVLRAQAILSSGESACHLMVLRLATSNCEADRRAMILDDFADRGLLAGCGPVPSPIHCREPFLQQSGVWTPKALRPKRRHETWTAGTCPVAEARCYREDILIASRLGWDQETVEDVSATARGISDSLEEIHDRAPDA